MRYKNRCSCILYKKIKMNTCISIIILVCFTFFYLRYGARFRAALYTSSFVLTVFGSCIAEGGGGIIEKNYD